METVRQIAWDVLNRCEKAGQYSNLALDAAQKRASLNAADKALLTVLVYGVTERKLTLDHWLRALSARPPEEISPDVRNLLRLGLYQLAYLDRIPDHAAVHETVAIAPAKAKGFVNAILREYGRRGKEIPYPDPIADTVGYLAAYYSVGEPLCRAFLAEFGRERTEAIFRAFGNRPPVTLRVNTLKTDRGALLERLLQAGYSAEPAGVETGIRVWGNAPVTELPGFAEGEFFVQDEASQRCVLALDARPGMRVIDVCACPGSKSFGAAISMQNRGTLLACDLHASKLSLVQSGAERLGISVIRTMERDARRELPEWETEAGQADRVLCDVPCSGFGVLAKKPELRYKDPEVSRDLPDIQLDILRASARLLRRGGKLIYSTCTVFSRENGRNVETFLAEQPAFRLEKQIAMTPDFDGTDGFFIAVLEKL